jgi:SNF2 family DNA or RNA helicase
MNFATKTELLPHQREAVAKQARSKVGALFMDMGTGKSRTAIGLAQYRQDRIRNVVWFCPVSLKETVRQEIIKHTSADQSQTYTFDTRTKTSVSRSEPWNIIGVESMSASDRLKMAAAHNIHHDSMVIVDESTHIKGHRSARTDWITRIAEKARYRLILTGTPMTQGVVDLFAQMRFLSEKILGYASFYSFAANHLEYSEKYPGRIVRAHNTEWLAAKIQPYVYQVTKAECLTLPDKIYERKYFSMTKEQRELYDQAKEDWMMEVCENDRMDSYAIFKLFTKLQRITSGCLCEHNRVDNLLYVVAAIPIDKKAVIWSKYLPPIAEIAKDLTGEYGEASVAAYHGKVPENQRDALVQAWKRPDGPRFFVATPSCAGHGLTLTEASYVIFYDDSFKYSERIQAEDRCHRIGQTEKVLYVSIECLGSIDERIATALASKGNALKQFRQEIEKVKDKGKLRKLVESL